MTSSLASLMALIINNPVKFIYTTVDTAIGMYGNDSFRLKVNFQNRLVSIQYSNEIKNAIFNMQQSIFLHIKIIGDKCHYMGIPESEEGAKALHVCMIVYRHVFRLRDNNYGMIRDYFPEVAFNF